MNHLEVIVLVGPLAAIVALPVWLTPTRIAFKEFGLTDVLHLLTVLALVALLLERALEIFVGTWRSPGARDLDLVLQQSRQNVARLQALPQADESALREAREALEEARGQELRYRCVTRRVALWTGLALGFLVSGVGVRGLESLVDPAMTSAWSAHQAAAFRLVDVLLTGGVVAGGSEGIHRIATVFDNFMTATAKRAKG